LLNGAEIRCKLLSKNTHTNYCIIVKDGVVGSVILDANVIVLDKLIFIMLHCNLQ